MMLTFDVERPASITALERAVKNNQVIFLTAQKDLTADMPQEDELYRIGTVCRIRQQLRQPRAMSAASWSGVFPRRCRQPQYRSQGLYRNSHAA